MVYLITYDLNKAGKDYAGLLPAIKSLSPEWRKPLLSTWLVDTSLSAQQIYDRLERYIDSDDRLLISRIHRGSQGWLAQVDGEWINSWNRTY